MTPCRAALPPFLKLPSIYDWEQTLAVNRNVRLVSTPTLVADVVAKQAHNDAYLACTRPTASSAETRHDRSEAAGEREDAISPLFILYKLGVLTTPPELPPIQ